MSDKPTHKFQVSIDGGELSTFTAPVTAWVASSGWSSGNYVTNVGGATVTYSASGTYQASYGVGSDRRQAPRYGSGQSVVFDFTAYGGPALEIFAGPVPEDQPQPAHDTEAEGGAFSPLIGQLFTQMSRDAAFTSNALIDGYRGEAETNAATLRAIRATVADLLEGDYMPTPFAIIRTLYPDAATIDMYRSER